MKLYVAFAGFGEIKGGIFRLRDDIDNPDFARVWILAMYFEGNEEEAVIHGVCCNHVQYLRMVDSEPGPDREASIRNWVEGLIHGGAPVLGEILPVGYEKLLDTAFRAFINNGETYIVVED